MQADFFNYPLQDFLHLSLMHLVLVIGRQNAGWKVLALSGLAGFLCSGLFICAGMFPCCVGVTQLFSGTEVHIWICLHALLVIVQVPACHHLSMRNSNCRPKVNSLVKWFLEDTLKQGLPDVCVDLLVLPLRGGEGSPFILTNFWDYDSSICSFIRSLTSLLLVLENKTGVVFFLSHDSSQAQCRIQVYVYMCSFSCLLLPLFA